MQDPILLPLLRLDKSGQIYEDEEGLKFISSLNFDELGVISITGVKETGISFLAERGLLKLRRTLTNRRSGDKVIMWVYNQISTGKNHQQNIIIDSGYIDEDNSAGVIAMLISNYCVVNFQGGLDQSNLSRLGVLLELVNSTLVRSETNEMLSSEEVTRYVSPLYFVFRDMPRKECEQSSMEYLTSHLEPRDGVKEEDHSLNKIKRMISYYFPQRDCSLLESPVFHKFELESLSTMMEAEMNPPFVENMKKIASKICSKGKREGALFKTGSQLLTLINIMVQTLNQNRKIIISHILRGLEEERLKDANKLVEDKLNELDSLYPFNQEQIETHSKRIMSLYKHALSHDIVNQSHSYILEMEDKILLALSKGAIKQTDHQSEELCEYIFSEQSRILSHLRSRKYDNTLLQADLNGLRDRVSEKYKDDLDTDKIDLIFYRSAYSFMHSSFEELISSEIKQLESKNEADYSMMRYEVEERRAANEELASRVQQLEADLDLARTDKLSFEMRLESLTSKYTEMKNQYNSCKDNNTENALSLQDQHKEQIRNLNRQIQELSIKNEELQKNTFIQISSLSTKIELREDEVSRKKEELVEERRLNESFQNTISRIKKDSEENENRLNQTISDLRLELDTLRKCNDEITEKYNRSIDEQRQLEMARYSSNKDVRIAESTITALQEELLRQKDSNSKLLQTIDAQLKNEKKTQKEINIIQEMHQKTLSTKVSEIENENESLRGYKNIVRYASNMQCANCNRFISKVLFPEHVESCIPSCSDRDRYFITSPSHPDSFASGSHLIPKAYPGKLFSMTISIPETMVKEDPSTKRSFTKYRVCIKINTSRFTLWKRYREFCSFHSLISETFPFLRFPTSSNDLFGAYSDLSTLLNCRRRAVTEERRIELEKYMVEMSKIDVVRNSKIFRTFLEISTNFEDNDQFVVQEATKVINLSKTANFKENHSDKSFNGEQYYLRKLGTKSRFARKLKEITYN